MFSDCEDDLCIFVCGVCKRYFTQLSAFAQHKKEKLCKKNNALQETWSVSSILSSNHIPDGTSEELDSDVLDNQDFSECSNEHLMNNEGNDCNSQKRKYPRKQDKTKIKRTVRDFETETQSLLCDRGELGTSAYQGLPQNTFPTFPISSIVRPANFLGQPSENAAFCRHPVYVCKVCHAEFPKVSGKPYRCSHCRRGFLTERELNLHVMRAKHDNLCNVCGKIFPDKYKLRKHTLSHVTEKKFPCDVPGCSKAFKSVEDVRTHVKYVHAAEKRFKCTQCMRAFSRPDKYKQHLLTHKKGSRSTPTHLMLENGVSLGEQFPGGFPPGEQSSFGFPPGEQSLVGVPPGGQSPVGFPPGGKSPVGVTPGEQSPVGVPLGEQTPAGNSLTKYDGDFGITGETNFHQNNLELQSSPTEGNGQTSSLYKDTPSSTNASMTAASPLFDAAAEGPSGNDTFKEENAQSDLPGSQYQETSSSAPSDQRNEVLSLNDNRTTLAGNEKEEISSVLAKNNEALTKEPDLPKYGCYNCGVHFHDEQSLDQHVKTHKQHAKAHAEALETSEGPECTRCHARFPTNNEYLAHEERRPDHVLRCTRCSLKFLSICELSSHQREAHNLTDNPKAIRGPVVESRPMRVDGQLRKHVCDECGKAFTRADKLRRHSIIHSPDRPCIPCVCRESHGCLITFYRKDSMKRHALTHTLEKPYKCDVCDKTFSRQDYVAKHINQVHNRAFKHRCSLCDYGSRELKRLRIHIRRRHEMDPNTVLPFDAQSVCDSKPDAFADNSPKSPEDTSPPADRTTPPYSTPLAKVTINDLRYSLPSSDTPDAGEVSAPDESQSEYVGQETARRRTVLPESYIQHYGSIPAIPIMNRTDSGQFASHDSQVMSNPAEEHSIYRTHQVFHSGYKTPLNSLTVPPQQPFGGVSNITVSSSHNVF